MNFKEIRCGFLVDALKSQNAQALGDSLRGATSEPKAR